MVKVLKKASLKNYLGFKKLKLIAFVIYLLLNPQKILAEGEIIRDVETLSIIEELTEPLLNSAGLNKQRVRFYLVNDRNINASAYGQYILINTGLILNAPSINEVIGVIAHEIGHIAASHTAIASAEIKSAMTMQLLSTLAGIGLGALSGEVGVAAGAMTIGSQMPMYGFYESTRSRETQADTLAAKYLKEANYSVSGIYNFMLVLYKMEQDGTPIDWDKNWMITHPASIDRLNFFKKELIKEKQNKNIKAIPQSYQARFLISKSKIEAYYAKNIKQVEKYNQNSSDFLKNYAKGIFYTHHAQPNRAIKFFNTALSIKQSIFVMEYKAYALRTIGKFKDAETIYKHILQYNKDSQYFLNLGLSQLNQDNPQKAKEALQNFNVVLKLDKDMIYAWKLKAMAYSKLKDDFNLNLSEGYFNYYSMNYPLAHRYSIKAYKLSKHNPSKRKEANELKLTVEKKLKKQKSK